MLIVMAQKASKEQVDKVVAEIEARGYTARPIPGGERVSIGVLNNKGPVDASLFTGLPGVKEVIPVTRPYKLVGREFQPDRQRNKHSNIRVYRHCGRKYPQSPARGGALP